MKEREIYMQLFDISINTYYNWKKENRPIIKLLEKYFTNDDLIEFLKKEQISKFDKFENYIKEKNKKIDLYLDFLLKLDAVIDDVMEEESFINVLINYNNEKTFLQNYINDINSIKIIFEEMIKYNIINTFEEIVSILNDTDLKILVERASYMGKQQKREATRYYIRYNIFKYKKNLHPIEKDEIYNSLMDLYYDYEDNILEKNKLIFNEIEKLKK